VHAGSPFLSDQFTSGIHPTDHLAEDLSTLAARGRGALDAGFGAATVAGPEVDRQVRAVAAFAGRNRLPIRFIDPRGEVAADLCKMFPTGITGAGLCWRGEIQAMKSGTRFALPHRVVNIVPQAGGWCLTLDNDARGMARAVLISTGVEYRRMALPGIAALEGVGICYAATKVEVRFCRDTDVVVVGDGNSAGQAAMYLSRSTRHEHVLVRGASLAVSMSG